MKGYPKIVANNGLNREWTGHNANWWIDEKVDGSNLSFVLQGTDIVFMNRNSVISKPYGWVFDKAISALSTLKKHLVLDHVYHGECIAKPKHNVIQYERVPKFYFVLFDIQDEDGTFLKRHDVVNAAKFLGIECVQCFHINDSESTQPTQIVDHLFKCFANGSIVSMFGGTAPEGIVIKHPSYLKSNHKVVATKIKVVRDEFKEMHRNGNKLAEKQVVTPQDSLDRIMSWYSADVRWRKATFRLRDQGKITGLEENAEKERQAIMNEARRDFQEEEEENLKAFLWAEFGQTLVQRITDGL